MPLKVQVGLARKIGQPDYGSFLAECRVEFATDPDAIATDPEGFRRETAEAYAACRRAVEEQLAGRSPNHQPRPADTPPPIANGHRSDPIQHNRTGRSATPAQAKALRAIVRRRGMDLAGLLRHRHAVESPEALTLSQASALIDELGEDRR